MKAKESANPTPNSGVRFRSGRCLARAAVNVRQRTLNMPHRYLYFLHGVVIVIYFGLFVLFGQFLDLGDLSKITKPDALSDESYSDGLKGRYFWGVSALLVTSALLWNLSLSLLIFFRFSYAGSRSANLFPIIVLGLALIPITMLIFGWSIPGEVSSKIHEINIENTNFEITVALDSLNIMAFLVILSLAFSLGTLIQNNQGNVTLPQLASRIELANLSLYSAAILLAVGVMEVYAQYSWASVHLNGEAKEAYSNATETLAVSAGAVFSALLLILYAPVGLIHKSWVISALHQAQRGMEEFDTDNWLRRNALDKTLVRSFGKISSIVFPALIGASIKLIGVQ